MTVKEPEEIARPIVRVDLLERVIEETPVEPPARVKTAPKPATKRDYRMRGLDLDAPAFVDSEPRLEHKKHPSRRRRRRRLIFQWATVLVVLAVSAVLLRAFVVSPYTVRSTSMVPNLQPGTSVLVIKPQALTGAIKTGDIVVFHRPTADACRVAGDTSKDLIKRVIGLPGQTISSRGERIYIDGKPLSESGWYNVPYGEVGPTDIAPTTIPAGTYYVLGDNRTDPCDSRAFGPITESSLVGRAVATTTRGGHPYLHVL